MVLSTALYCSAINGHSAEVTYGLSVHLGSTMVEDNSGNVFLDPSSPETGATNFTSNEASGGFSANALSTRLYAEARYEPGYSMDPDTQVTVNIRDIVTVNHTTQTGSMGLMRFRYNVTGNLLNDVSMTPASAYGHASWGLRTRLTSGGFDETRGGSLRTDTGASGDTIPGTGLTLTYEVPITFGTQFEFHREFSSKAMIDTQGENLGSASWKIGAYLQYSFNYMGAEFLVSDGGGGFTPLDNNDISTFAASGSDYRFAGSAPAEVPEPSSSTLFLAAGLVLLKFRRR